MEDTTKYIFLLLLVFPLSTEAKHGGKQICIILFPETEYYSAVCICKIAKLPFVQPCDNRDVRVSAGITHKLNTIDQVPLYICVYLCANSRGVNEIVPFKQWARRGGHAEALSRV